MCRKRRHNTRRDSQSRVTSRIRGVVKWLSRISGLRLQARVTLRAQASIIAMVVERPILVVQNPLRRSVEVVILAALESPKEQCEPGETQGKRDGDAWICSVSLTFKRSKAMMSLRGSLAGYRRFKVGGSQLIGNRQYENPYSNFISFIFIPSRIYMPL
jgi:hypothetical protein